MTIQEMSDAYIGYPHEIDEGSCTFAKRLAYEQGAKDMLIAELRNRLSRQGCGKKGAKKKEEQE